MRFLDYRKKSTDSNNNFFIDVFYYIAIYFTILFILIELFKSYIVYWSVCIGFLFISFIITTVLVIIVEKCRD